MPLLCYSWQACIAMGLLSLLWYSQIINKRFTLLEYCSWVTQMCLLNRTLLWMTELSRTVLQGLYLVLFILSTRVFVSSRQVLTQHPLQHWENFPLTQGFRKIIKWFDVLHLHNLFYYIKERNFMYKKHWVPIETVSPHRTSTVHS